MTFQKIFVDKKIDLIIGYLKESQELFRFSDDDIVRDFNKLHSAERLLQLIVDTIIDINEHFIKELELPAAEDYQSTFKILADNKILSADFAQKIAPAVGLRNRIVHRYEEVNKAFFLKSFRENVGDFQIYLHCINTYFKQYQ